MPLLDILRAVRDQTRDERNSLRANYNNYNELFEVLITSRPTISWALTDSRSQRR